MKFQDNMRRFLMKKGLLFIISLFLLILSGCILSKTPNTNNVTMKVGEQKTFSVNVFPPGSSYEWTLDGSPVLAPGNSYTYTALARGHSLVVRVTHLLGMNKQAWYISQEDPITELLNSLLYIPAGTFMMGSTDYWSTIPIHQVTLSEFYMSAYEVTQVQYQAVMGTNPSYFQAKYGYPGRYNYPVDWLTWYDASAFCTQLSAMTGRTFTLPSEAQWEYACRSGTTTPFSFGSDDEQLDNYAWYGENLDTGTTHPVGEKLPNAWGLYDMMGNVWEWCLDSWHENYVGAPTDGSAWEPDIGTYRLTRGGSFLSEDSWNMWSSSRNYCNPSCKNNNFGFRIIEIP